MALLSKEAILAAKDLPSEDVDVAEWGGSVRVRSMTGAERDGYELSMIDQKTGQPVMQFENVRARLVALTAIDADGNLLFTAADVIELGKKSAAALNRVYAVAARLNGLTKSDVEELAKN